MQQFNKGKYESPYRSGSPGPDLRSSGNSSKLRFSDEQKELMPGKGILHLDWSNNGIFELDTLHSFSDLVSLNLAHNQLNMITAPIKSWYVLYIYIYIYMCLRTSDISSNIAPDWHF